METVIGLLIALVIFVFRVIRKKLEQAGQDGSMKPVSRPSEGGIVDVEAWIKAAVEEAGNEETEYVKPVEAPVARPEKVSVEENVSRQTPVKKAVRTVRKEPVKPKDKEKIDPKKLIVYSEIMKPKYTE